MFGAGGGGIGLFLARKNDTSSATSSSVNESRNGGIFCPPFRIWSVIFAGSQSLSFRRSVSEGAFLPPTPPMP